MFNIIVFNINNTFLFIKKELIKLGSLFLIAVPMVNFKENTRLYITVFLVVAIFSATFFGVRYISSLNSTKKVTSVKLAPSVFSEKLTSYLEELPNKTDAKNKKEQTIVEVNKNIETGEYTQASKKLEVLLNTEVKNPENKTGTGKVIVTAAKVLLAQAYLAEGNSSYKEQAYTKKALDLLEGATKSEGEDDDYGAYGKYFVGYAYEITRQYDKALFYYNKGLKISTNTDKMKAVFENQIGHIYDLQGDVNKAYDTYKKAYNFNPGDPNIGLNIARSLVRMKKLQEAIPYFEAGIKVKNNASASEAAYDLATIYLYVPDGIKNNLDKSLKLAKFAIEKNKKYPLGYVGEARAYILQRKNLDIAQAQLEKAIALYPKLTVAYEWLGLLHQSKGIYDKAIDNFLLSVKYLPEDITLMKDQLIVNEARLYFHIASTCSMGKNNEETMVYINKMLALQNMTALAMLKMQLAHSNYGMFAYSKGYKPFEDMVVYFK